LNSEKNTACNKGLASGGVYVSVRQFFVNLGIVARSDFSCRKSRPNAKPRPVSGNAKPKQGTMKPELKRIRKVEYDIDPNRYELRSGSETNAPLCPYGNIYKWVVFDLKANEYVRFAKSVFKLLINKNGK